MISLLSLWLPILVSAALVYVAAFVLNAVIPLHSKDFLKLPNEDAIIDTVRAQEVQRGQYMFPGVESREEWNSPEWAEKANRGPVGILFVLPSGTGMSKQLIFQALYTLAISIMAGYMGTASLGPGTSYLGVFQVVGTAAFLGHSFGHFTHAIWYGFSWKVTWVRVFEGLLYGALTAGVFGWLWPQ